jgi:hypothetical protein
LGFGFGFVMIVVVVVVAAAAVAAAAVDAVALIVVDNLSLDGHAISWAAAMGRFDLYGLLLQLLKGDGVAARVVHGLEVGSICVANLFAVVFAHGRWLVDVWDEAEDVVEHVVERGHVDSVLLHEVDKLEIDLHGVGLVGEGCHQTVFEIVRVSG